jgi:hypothetical protein
LVGWLVDPVPGLLLDSSGELSSLFSTVFFGLEFVEFDAQVLHLIEGDVQAASDNIANERSGVDCWLFTWWLNELGHSGF